MAEGQHVNLHQAAFIAGELIALTVAGYALVMVWKQHRERQEELQQARDWPERGETTQYSSMNDD